MDVLIGMIGSFWTSQSTTIMKIMTYPEIPKHHKDKKVIT